jgi:hypothetical protein
MRILVAVLMSEALACWSSPCWSGAARSACAAPLGATRGHVGAQFLMESLLLGAAGGPAGIMLGTAVTYAMTGMPVPHR